MLDPAITATCKTMDAPRIMSHGMKSSCTVFLNPSVAVSWDTIMKNGPQGFKQFFMCVSEVLFQTK